MPAAMTVVYEDLSTRSVSCRLIREQVRVFSFKRGTGDVIDSPFTQV